MCKSYKIDVIISQQASPHGKYSNGNMVMNCPTPGLYSCTLISLIRSLWANIDLLLKYVLEHADRCGYVRRALIPAPCRRCLAPNRLGAPLGTEVHGCNQTIKKNKATENTASIVHATLVLSMHCHSIM